MAEMKSRHAFGSEANINSAIEQGLIDAYDVLLLNEGKIGWIDKNGNPVILETDTSEIEAKIDKIASDIGECLFKKYEIAYKPEGTLVNYRDKEIRVMCPSNTVWTKQNVGSTGNANMYYMGFKAYAPDDAVSFKEDDQAIIEDQTMYYFENNDFAGIDESGRKYSIVWLALASYDEETDNWTYFGEKSNAERYIGWYYSVEWYNTDGAIIDSDCIRINLTNEGCHSSIEPYYISEIMKKVETKIAEATTYGIIEF